MNISSFVLENEKKKKAQRERKRGGRKRRRMSWLQKQIQEQIQKAEGPSIHRSIRASEMIDHVYA